MRATRLLAPLLVAFAASLPGGGAAAQDEAAGWAVVDYAKLVDGRRISHSGQPVGVLLERLGGRPVPPAGQRPEDLRFHKLLEPVLEPYAFVLSDVLDGIEPPAPRPLIEVAQLWHPGERQPAWVELLRARRYVVESDGAGTLRVVLPWETDVDPRTVSSSAAAVAAWNAAWPVLRHVFAAERRRLAAGGEAPTLEVRAYPYLHLPARSLFLLGVVPHRVAVDSTDPAGDRPPLDVEALRQFLASGWTLEGGKLGPAGEFRPTGSRAERPSTFLGRKPTLADLAVAYRAAAHGGLAEPYMSLDRGYSPWRSLVTYGARLRDTTLGVVSLLCDVRFKTFSMGLGIEEGLDLREAMREAAPGFKTHVEQFSAHPGSAGIQAQQTRLWFYPDRVDMTVSAQGDLLALRRVRMTAAAERVLDESMTPAKGADPPWTLATVDSINRDYDALAGLFPELSDLDQVVRMLSLFTWLERARESGLTVPELDLLLAYELPPTPTPPTFPQLLAYNAMPPAGSRAAVDSYDRVAVGEALERLNPMDGDVLPADVRLRRALAALDRRLPEHAALLDGIAARDVGALRDEEIDLLTYRAQRLRMHRTVLATLPDEPSRHIERRRRAGEAMRVLSLGIGGLDLGMGQVLARAQGRRLGLVGAGPQLPSPLPAVAPLAATAPREPRAEWRRDPPSLPAVELPAHGLAGGLRAEFGGGWVERIPGVSGGGGDGSSSLFVVYGAEGARAVARRVEYDAQGTPRRFERFEEGRRLRYAFERSGRTLRAVPEPLASPADTAVGEDAALPPRLAMMRIEPRGGRDSGTPNVALRLESAGSGALDAATPRWVLQRLVMGRAADPARDASLPGVAPLPPSLGEVETLMVLGDERLRRRPWEDRPAAVAGEQDPVRVAAAVSAWWRAPDAPSVPGGAVVGVDATRSPSRWEASPRPGERALLVLAPDAFAHGSEPLRRRLARAWGGRVSERIDPSADERLVLVVGDEAPGLLARRLSEAAALAPMKGKLLAGWSLAGPLRRDVPAWILERDHVAGFGVATGSILERREAVALLKGFSEALATSGSTVRVEALPGPFLWYF